MTVNFNGKEIDYESAVMLMDDDIRESVAYDDAPCSPQEFFDEYCRRHYKKYGIDFLFN